VEILLEGYYLTFGNKYYTTMVVPFQVPQKNYIIFSNAEILEN
jgi:hypothetical protein